MGKMLFILVIFLVIGGYMIYSAYDYDLHKTSDVKSFGFKFGRWVWHIGSNVKEVTNYAGQKEWLPDTNQSNSTGVKR
jgi:hypothetical protein